jgi:hypothetical protein
VVENARAPKVKGDVWLTVRFDEFKPDEFPKIGRVRPYWKPHPKFDNAEGFFDASKADAADVVVIPLTELLRLLETELKGVRQSKRR